jgi:hypothetical protein
MKQPPGLLINGYPDGENFVRQIERVDRRLAALPRFYRMRQFKQKREWEKLARDTLYSGGQQ